MSPIHPWYAAFIKALGEVKIDFGSLTKEGKLPVPPHKSPNGVVNRDLDAWDVLGVISGGEYDPGDPAAYENAGVVML